MLSIKLFPALEGIFLFSALSLQAMQWTPGTQLPESQAVVKTIPQILEEASQKRKIGLVFNAPFQKLTLRDVDRHSPPVSREKVPFHNFRMNDVAYGKPEAPLRSLANIKDRLLNFSTATYEDSGIVPPDAMGVVGPAQFILAANGRIRSFDKGTGLPDHVLDLSSDLFFSPIADGFTSDPRIRYDRFSDRWYVIITAPTMHPIRLLLAVSASGVIKPETEWSFFYFEPRPSDWADYPTLGIDKNALYIGMNFLKNQQYVTSDAFVIKKAPLLKGKLQAYAFLNIVSLDPTKFEGPISPQGVDNYDSNATEGYIIGIDGRPGRLMLRRIKDLESHPVISENIPITVSNSDFPLDVPQKGSIEAAKFFLQGFDKRLGNTHVRDQLLYTAHSVGVNNYGNPAAPDPTRDGCLWYQIDLNDADHPVVKQSGILFQPSSENDRKQRFFWMPGVMTNGLHSLIMVCCTSGDQVFADGAYALRYSNDPKGSMREPQIFTHSQMVYSLGFPPFQTLRWGEYTTASVDPTDNMTLWCISEFTVKSTSWGLQAIRIPAQPPAKISIVEPSTLKSGQKEILVTINGERVEGSAFYDPDKNFPNHLSVEIEDVKVTKVKSVSPAQIELIVSTEGSKEGMKSIKVTNPDGQMVEIKEVLKIE